MIDATAIVKSKNIGNDTDIWQYTVVLEGAKIGLNCNINCHCFIENNVIIGDNCTIKSGVYIWDGIIIEDDVFVGPNATFVNNNNARSKQYPEKHIGCIIQKGCTIGANSTILAGLKIEKYAFVAAGAVVTKNVSPFQLVAGNPAKQVGFVTKSGLSLDLDLKDQRSGDQYFWNDLGEIEKR